MEHSEWGVVDLEQCWDNIIKMWKKYHEARNFTSVPPSW
jgi:hypothetical protein